MMNFAEINAASPRSGEPELFLLLRALHYAAEYHQVREVRFPFAEPPAEVTAIWWKSLKLRKRELVLIYQSELRDVPPFTAPELAFRLNGQETIRLGIPAIPGLTDFHLHTRLAYCSENMEVAAAAALERLSGVEFVNFAEHSGQLYCSADTYWNNRFLWRTRRTEEERTEQYHALIQAESAPDCTFGTELDVDADAVAIDVPGLTGFRLGAIHFLGNDLTYEEKKLDFMRRLDGLLASRIDILAHPFRVFLKGGLPIPEELFEPVAEKLIRAHVAAEINFHTNRPQPEFIELLLKKGGKISFGTDSHNLYEAGYFMPHYKFCRELGIAGKLDELLLSAETRRKK